ncbi:MAG: hypothetical protein ACI9FB_000229 [Candidatus Azotimanducaceae bacterium]|jgi:hypothetical protein
MTKVRFLLPYFLLGIIITGLTSSLAANEGDTVNKTLLWADGTRYVGEVREGKRWGKGTIFWRDGTRFVGTFANDLRNGPGTMILPDGSIYNGYFTDDALVKTPPSIEEINTAKTEIAEATDTINQATPVSETSIEDEPPLQVPLELNVTELTDAVRLDLESTIDLWAAAWSDKNVIQYLAYYSDEFEVPGKQSRRQWEALRKSRLQRPKSINVSIVFESVSITALNIAKIEFMQSYESNLFSDQTRKQFILKKEGGFWKIISEQSV